MREVRDEEIEFILEDLEKRGIELEDLRFNLLDHICIIIEEEMSADADFNQFYQSILPRFFEKELSEIQTETNNLIRFKHFYAMKNTLNISGAATVLFTILGAILKTFHLPGAGICIVLGGFLLSFVFLPLLIVLKFKDEESKTDKWVFSFGFLIGITLTAGLIFKLMHWPGANILMIGSTIVFTGIYVPLYFFTRFRRPEIRFNTIVNSVLMLACGGIFYSLFDLSYSYKYSKQISEDHRFMHDNSVRLFDSNERLASWENQSAQGQQLHNQSVKINEGLESLAMKILEDKTTSNISEGSEDVSSLIEEYNHFVANLGSDEVKTLDPSGLQVLNRLSIQMALNTLARLQQQMVVNENCFLTTSFIAMGDQ